MTGNYDFQVHLLHSQRICRLSQSVQLQFKALPGLSLALQGLTPALTGALLVVTRPPGSHRDVTRAPKTSWQQLRQSSHLWVLTTLGFWSNNSQTLPEATSNIVTFCWRKLSHSSLLSHVMIMSQFKLTASTQDRLFHTRNQVPIIQTVITGTPWVYTALSVAPSRLTACSFLSKSSVV